MTIPKLRHHLRLWILLFGGSLISALAINVFYLPFNLTMGGISGVAAIIFNLLQGHYIPFGVLVILLNIPMLLLGIKEIGWRFIWKSLIGTVVFSLVIDLTSPFMHNWFQSIHKPIMGVLPDPFIYCCVGGVLFGIGLGMIFLAGYTTGGTDILAFVIKKHMRHLSMGQIILLLDLVIIGATLFFYKEGEQGSPWLLVMYSCVALWVTTKSLDAVLEGFDIIRLAYIISDHSDAISAAIMQTLDRGCTALAGEGKYTGKSKEVLLCALSTRQIGQLKELVNAIDPKAFVIVTAAHEVHGEGFNQGNSPMNY